MKNTRLNLIKTLQEKYPKGKGVEIGVFKGEFSKEILNVWDGTLYMVDVWRGIDEGYDDSSNHHIHNDAYEKTMKNIKGLEDRGIMIRATSLEASKLFLDESIDFIYIDANHAYDFVKEDIEFWYPKLKKGGLFSGHDYLDLKWYEDPNFLPNQKDKYIFSGGFYNGVFGVNPAVDEFCKEKNYELNTTTDDDFFLTWWLIK